VAQHHSAVFGMLILTMCDSLNDQRQADQATDMCYRLLGMKQFGIKNTLQRMTVLRFLKEPIEYNNLGVKGRTRSGLWWGEHWYH